LTYISTHKKKCYKMLCNICYQEVDNGVIVPGFQKAAGICHEDCITEATLKIAADPSKEGLLRHLVEYEESRTPKTGQGISLMAAPTSAGSGRRLISLITEYVRCWMPTGDRCFRTNRSTNYALVGRRIIKEALNTEEQTTENTLKPSKFLLIV